MWVENWLQLETQSEGHDCLPRPRSMDSNRLSVPLPSLPSELIPREARLWEETDPRMHSWKS